MIIRLRQEEHAYLKADLTITPRYATWKISWTGAPVRDPRHQLLHVTPFLRDLGIIHLPMSSLSGRTTYARFGRLTSPSPNSLKQLILAREERNIASAFSTSALGSRFYDLSLGFIPRPPPVFGGALSCSLLELDYRAVFASVCKEKGGKSLVVCHVNNMHVWVKAFQEADVDINFGGMNVGAQIISYHSMRHLHLPPVDRIIFEDSHMFGPGTRTVSQAESLKAPIRWCVSKLPRTSFPALHGTMRMLNISPFTRRDVSWNNAVDRSMSVLGSGPYYNLLKRIFVVVPETPTSRPKVEQCIVEPGELANLLKNHTECEPKHPYTYLNVQSSMLSSTLLPLSGFAVTSSCVSLEDEMARREIPLTRREEIRKEMKDKCPVCLEHVDDWRLSFCNHILCPRCVDACRTLTQNTCPICRAVWHLPFVHPMGEEAMKKFKEEHKNLLGHWVTRETKRLWEKFRVGPKTYEVQRLVREGTKSVVVCAHKKHAAYLGQFLKCPYLCSGLRPTQRWQNLEAFDTQSCLVCTSKTFLWSTTLQADRLIFVDPPTRSEWRACLKGIRTSQVFVILAAGFPEHTQSFTFRRSNTVPPQGFSQALTLVYDASGLLV